MIIKSREVDEELKCQYCESVAILPFKCPFCGGYFCAEHRLPEKHGCSEIRKALQRRDEQEVKVEGVIGRQEQHFDYEIPTSRSKVFGVSATELKHLAAGTLIVSGVGFSIFAQGSRITGSGLYTLAGSVLVFTLSFILHEIAHKAAAQNYGLWAEFRLTLLGALITLLSVIPWSPIKIISPGVVRIAGAADKEKIGKISLAGPATNIILSVIFLILSVFLDASFVLFGAVLNPWMALFNLIPFSIFDGEKVFWWDKKVWAVSFGASIVLTYFGLRLFFLLS